VAGRVVGSDVEGEEKIAGGASIVARRNAQFVVVRRRPIAVWNITTNITTSSSSPSSCLLVPTQATAPEKKLPSAEDRPCWPPLATPTSIHHALLPRVHAGCLVTPHAWPRSVAVVDVTFCAFDNGKCLWF